MDLRDMLRKIISESVAYQEKASVSNFFITTEFPTHPFLLLYFVEWVNCGCGNPAHKVPIIPCTEILARALATHPTIFAFRWERNSKTWTPLLPN